MKKLLLILLSLTLVLSFAACGDDTPEVTCEHVDLDGDFKCEFCGEQLPCGDDHVDANADKKCDRCDEDVPVTPITIAEAITICNQAGETPTTERYYIKGIVKSVLNPAYGQMVVKDETGEIEVYGSYSADGATGYAALEDKPYAGDEVLLYCTLQSFGGEPEVKSAWIIEFTHIEADISDYNEATIAEARAAEVGALLKVDGVVAAITYANGKVPAGVILVDETSSIYIYDGDVAARVAVGNKITVAGAKAYWILDTEQTNAEKFGYKGCNQLENATLVDNDGGNNAFDKTWITETTMMDLLDTPVTEDITTTIYKVTALVKKAPGNGFTNYYFNDLDGVTGSYAYTQCNGSDFAWLDQFDGKICTVYITALNAKSTATDCYFRVLPVAVIDEGFTFDTTKTAEHIVKYYGLKQFLSTYSGDPALELLSSVSSEILGFENATLSYTSSNSEIITIATEEGKIVMHCVGAGTATVTVTGSYNGNTYEETVDITVTENDSISSITVSEAIAAENGTTVTVKGIVGPSVANQPSGFYLIDSTGAITVRLASTDMLSGLAIGHEIVLTGTRTITKEGGGQICLDTCEIVSNAYGSNKYSTESFITDKTIEDITKHTDSPAETVKVYVVTGEIEVQGEQYATKYFVSDGTNKFLLYSGSPGQYAWLAEYAGQELTIEVAVCDWNAKGLKGCVLSITTADGTQIFNEYNFG